MPPVATILLVLGLAVACKLGVILFNRKTSRPWEKRTLPEGQPYFVQEDKTDKSIISVSIRIPYSSFFLLQESSFVSRFLRVCRISFTQATGDAGFDRVFAVADDDGRIIGSLATNPQMRLWLMQQVSKKIRARIIGDSRDLSIEYTGDGLKHFLHGDVQEQIAGHLYALAISAQDSPKNMPLAMLKTFKMLHLTLLFAGIIGATMAFVHARLLDDGLFFAAGGVALLLSEAWLWLLKIIFATPARVAQVAGNFMAFGVVGLILFMPFLAYELNMLDQGAGKTVMVSIVDKYASSSTTQLGQGRRHSLLTEPLPGFTQKYELADSEKLFSNAKPGDKVRLTIRPGLFGAPWVSDEQLISQPKL